eukprot:TRINITY_DN9716_c0_g1_i1.p1 TRINITY_DN9716_c0_g1~~TRINITY_DN9716_c0_g1_i1.p1  ORF type:complete len:594 (+),score=179.24 TRINITY_DN9716_c0_g1_i1:59-1840(+)
MSYVSNTFETFFNNEDIEFKETSKLVKQPLNPTSNEKKYHPFDFCYSNSNLLDFDFNSIDTVELLNNIDLETDLLNNINRKLLKKNQTEFSLRQKYFQSWLNSYHDVLMIDPNFDHQKSYKLNISIHITNMILKQTRLVARNTAMINKYKAFKKQEQFSQKIDDIYTSTDATDNLDLSKIELPDDFNPESEILRDQGFTRPTVLILAPTKKHGADWVQLFIKLFPNIESVGELKKFKSRFVVEQPPRMASKSDDFQYYFNEPDDDNFMIGISLHKKKLYLFSNYDNSDMLIASPVKMKQYLDENPDILSSIQLVTVDLADFIEMQNWDHLISCFDKLSVRPDRIREGAKILRLRHYFIQENEQLMSCFRQNIILSSFQFPKLLSLFKTYCRSHVGQIRTRTLGNNCTQYLPAGCSLHLHRLSKVDTVKESLEKRVDYLKDELLLPLGNTPQIKILLVVSTRVEFLMVKKMLDSIEANYLFLSEYWDRTERQSAWSRFTDLEVQILLISERYYFYHREKLRKFHSIVQVAPLQNPFLQQQLFESLSNSKSNSPKITILFTKYERLCLDRIIGYKETQALLNSVESDDFLITSEE